MNMVFAADAATLEKSVDDERSRVMTARLRWLVYTTLGIVFLFMAVSPVANTGPKQSLLLLRLTTLILATAFLIATYRSFFARYQSMGGLILVALIAGLSARAGALRGDLAITVSLHLILLLSCAAILPWGLGCQLAVVALCALSMGWTIFEVGLPGTGDVGQLLLLNLVAGAVLSLVLSLHTRHSFDRGVRENLRLRAAEQHNRRLNEDL